MASATKRSLRVLFAVVALTLGAVSALIALRYPGEIRGLLTRPAVEVEKLTIALPMVPHAALLLLADSNGYFTEEGLDVTIKPVVYGKLALDLMVQGQADLASAAEEPFVIAVMKGERLGIVATVASASNELTIVARRDRAIGGAHDLMGKKVGLTLRTSGDFCLWLLAIRHQLPPDSMALVNLPPEQMVRQLVGGTVDAVSTWEPIKSQARIALSGNAVSFGDSDLYSVSHVVFGRSEFLRTRPGAIRKLLRALLKAEDFNRSEPQQAQALIADRLKLERPTLASGWRDFSFKVDLTQSLLVTLEDEASWAMARAYVDPVPSPNFLPHLSLDALLAVQPERVTVVH